MNDTAVKPCVVVKLQWYLSDTAVIVMHLLLTCIGMVPIGEEHWGESEEVQNNHKGHVENRLTAAFEIISQHFCEQNLWTGG